MNTINPGRAVVPPSTSVRMRAAGVTTRLNELTAEVTQERAVLDAAVSSGNPDRILAAQATVATLEAARTNLSPIAEALNRELAAAEAEEAREATLRGMVATALDDAVGCKRSTAVMLETHTKLTVALQPLRAEQAQHLRRHSAFLAGARALGVPLDSARPEQAAAREALLEELGRRGLAALDLRAVQDPVLSLPAVEPLGRFICDMLRLLEFIEARQAQQEALEEEAVVRNNPLSGVQHG